MSTSRRGFLKSVLGTGAATTALPGCMPEVNPSPVADVTPDPETGAVTLVVARYPDLAPVGGSVTLRRPGLKPLLVVHRAENTFSVLDATCTHMGCPLGYDGKDVVCPCHAARFDAASGTVKQRPAPAALQAVKPENVTYEAGVLTLQFGDVGFPPALNGTVTLPFSQFPELRDRGGVVTGTPRGYGRPLSVSRQQDGTLVAVDTTCTHNGCPVNLEQGQFVCPCHGAMFALDGSNVAGWLNADGVRTPTPPLKKLPVTETTDAVIVSGVR
ncbi:Rieske 2Fe-2S domain-containing protein [Pyxidicoccus sp. 3LG]